MINFTLTGALRCITSPTDERAETREMVVESPEKADPGSIRPLSAVGNPCTTLIYPAGFRPGETYRPSVPRGRFKSQTRRLALN
jgi:hypothetical protein